MNKAISLKLWVLLLLGLILFSPVRAADRYESQKYVKYGKTYFKQNDLTQAMRSLKYATQLDPTNDEPHAVMGDIYAYFKNYTEAKKEYQKALKLNPKNYYYHYFLGLIYLQEGNFKKAQEYFQSSLIHNRKYADTYYNLGLIYHKSGDLKKEESSFKTAVKLAPKNSKYLFALGKNYEQQKKYLEAMSAYERLLGIAKKNDQLYVKADKELKQLKSKYQLLALKGMLQKFMAGLLGLIVGIILLIFVFRRSRTNKDLEDRFGTIYGETVPAVCEDLLAKLCQLTQMPFGVVYLISPTLDQLLPSIAANEDISSFKPLAFNTEAMLKWEEKNKTQPFLFNTEKKSGLFMSAFPDIAEKLEALDIRVGVPGFAERQICCLILLGSPRSKESAHLRQIYEENKKLINRMGVRGAELLNNLLQENYARLDSDTGVYNRQAFDRQLPEELTKSKNYNSSCALMMIELDYHDQILAQIGENDYRSIIRQVVDEIRGHVRQNDYLARYSPGILAMIMPETEVREAISIAETIRCKVAALTLSEAYPKVTVSLAVAAHPFHSLSQDELLDMLMDTLGDLRMAKGNKSAEVTRREKPVFKEKALSKTRLSDDDQPPIFPGSERSELARGERPKIALGDALPEDKEKQSLDWHEPITTSSEEDTPFSRSTPRTPFMPGVSLRPKGEEAPPALPVKKPYINGYVKPEAEQEAEPPAMRPFGVGLNKEAAPGSEAEPPMTKPFGIGIPREAEQETEPPAMRPFGMLGETEKSASAPPSIRRPYFNGPKTESSEEAPAGLKARPSLGFGLPPREPETKSPEAPEDSLDKPSYAGESASQIEEPASAALKPFAPSPGFGDEEPDSGKIESSTPKIMRPFSPKITRNGEESKPEKDEESVAQPLRNQVWKKLTDTGSIPASPLAFVKPPVEEEKPEEKEAQAAEPAAHLPVVEEIPASKPPFSEASVVSEPVEPLPTAAIPAPVKEEPAPSRSEAVAKPELVKDQRTGFYRREGFEPYLESELAQAQERNESSSQMFFSIDKISQLEEKYGKTQVENLVGEISGLVDTFLREGKDVPIVYEDNIMAVFLPKTPSKIAKNLAAQIIFTVGNSVFAEIIEKITLSIGIASFPEQAASAPELIKKGLLALEEAIAQGGNQIKSGV